MKKIDTKQYIAKKGQKIADYATSYNGSLTKERSKIELEKIKLKMDQLQELLYANGKESLLIIFQAMDAAGKDGAIEHVMSGLNPQGCQVYSFKAPNSEEYKHDFLWRHYKALPERGKIGVHNRSHYEYALVCKVHPNYIMAENIPGYDTVDKLDSKFWKNRYASIRNFEKHLVDNGTIVLKFFLNVSRDEQKQRFLDRIADPAKNWKFESGDIRERGFWDDYMLAYQQVFNETSTPCAPWYVVPADNKWYTRLVISQTILEALQHMDLKSPVLPQAEQDKLREAEAALNAEK